MSTTLIQIKHCRIPDTVIFECQVPVYVENKIKYAVEEAVRQKKSLAFADLSNMNLRGSDLSFADLRYADLSHNTDLSFTDLYRTDLYRADLRGSVIRGSELSFADLRFADLSHAYLPHANLSHANLSCADLEYSYFHKTELHHTDLYHANLSHANFIFSDLFSSSFQCATFNETIIDGETVSKIPTVVGGGLRWHVIITEGYMKIGRQRHKHEEWKSFNDHQISDMDKDALEFWNRYSVVLLSMCDIQSK